jgi:hypothetical protein
MLILKLYRRYVYFICTLVEIMGSFHVDSNSRPSFQVCKTRKNEMVNCNVFHDYGIQNVLIIFIGLVIKCFWFLYIKIFICSRFVRI